MENTTYLKDDFVTTKTGTAYRLFPFGKIVKNGKTREITPETASQFKLPHFRPAVKLGSHDDVTPAGGHIIGLEVRTDGLYAIPEWNEKGEQALADGAYRYHSPEVIWADGAIEDPTDGHMINGPLIVGDALLHMPHLGEATALYSIEPIPTEENIMENVTIPASLWEKFTALLTPREPEKVEVVKEVVKEPEDYAATVKERDELKAKIEQADAEKAKVELLNSITQQLQNKEDFGMSYVELRTAEEAAGMMAGMSPEQRDWVMRNFKAYIAQIKESNLTTETGTEGGTGAEDPKAAFNAAVLALAAEKKIVYTAAFEEMKVKSPDLFAAAFKK